MTQPDLFRLSPPVRESTEPQEFIDRARQRDLVERWFRRHPNVWIPRGVLDEVSHGTAGHSRVAELKKSGMTIESRKTYWEGSDGKKHAGKNEYRFVVPRDLWSQAS